MWCLLFLQEVIRIKNEHPDDTQCIVNDRVKGRLKVTRAFGAGFLKQVSFKYFVQFIQCFMRASGPFSTSIRGKRICYLFFVVCASCNDI